MSSHALLHLLRLTSPALPIGAFAWSQGLEGAIERGWVSDEAGLLHWLRGLAENMLTSTDLAVMSRVYDLATKQDITAIQHWNDTLLAMRESREFWQEDTQLGAAMKRMLLIEQPALWFADLQQPAYAVVFSLAAHQHAITRDAMLTGFVWAWVENLVTAAVKTVPLGQSAGQRVLNAFIQNVDSYIGKALALNDDELGAVMPGLALVSAWHETQYSRLFRS